MDSEGGKSMTGVVRGAVKGGLLSEHFLREILGRRFERRLGEASLGRADRAARRWWRDAQAVLGPASGVRAIRDVGVPLFGLLGYQLRAAARDVAEPDEGSAGLVCAIEGRQGVAIDLIVVPWGSGLDRVWRSAVRVGIAGRRRWVFAFNGHALRIIDVDRPYARRYVEFDLAETLGHDGWFPIFWGLARAPVFAATADEGVLFGEIVRASEQHGAGVRAGLQTGVRVALTRLSLALGRAARRQRDGGGENPEDVVAQALTLIYRLLFLLFAEARGLVPIWHPIYRHGYSLAMLQRQIDEPRGGDHEGSGLWEAVRAISRLAHAGCETDEFSMTAFNGRLFSPKATPLGERARISSAVVADVLRALTRTRGGGRRGAERITYRDLGVEELGAIYERVLDHFPAVEGLTSSVMARAGPRLDEAQARSRDGPAAGRMRRKESGTFYTPRSMADYLVRLTLGPLVDDATPEQVLGLRVLDPAMGSGAFLVCACRYLAWAYERALDRANRPLPASVAERAEIKRWIARQCLFGVDINPVAVQLARLSLWLTTLTADAPLTFLDHHLRAGDSLVGASMEDLARRLPADAALARARGRSGRGGGRRWVEGFPLFGQDEVAGSMRAVLGERARLVVADDSPAVVREKEQLLEGLARDSAIAGWQRLADIWCASWFWDSSAGPGPSARAWPVLCDFVRGDAAALPAAQLQAWVAEAEGIARRRRFFHWVLEFPEAFHDRDGWPLENGGFDAVVGNPPWNVLRADGGRGEPRREEGRGAQAMLGRFVRESGIYEPLPDAHPNLYQLFVDRSLGLLKRGGRLGLVAPWGLACDHGSARLRHRLFERCALDTVVSFDNSARVFPIHPGLRFMLFSCTKGRPTGSVRCRLGVRDPRVLDRVEMEAEAKPEPGLGLRPGPGVGRGAGVVLTMGLLRRVSGEGLAIPDVRAPIELALLDRIHAMWPALGSSDGWGVAFGRELNATDDRALMGEVDEGMRDGEMAGMRGGMYVIEGKHLQPFRVCVERAQYVVLAREEAGVRARVRGVARARLAYREVAFPGQRLALVAAMLPAGVVSTHTVFCLKSVLPMAAQWCLCALLNSVVCNYLVRLRAGAHVTAALLHGLPVPRVLGSSWVFRELGRLARRLAVGGDGRGRGRERKLESEPELERERARARTRTRARAREAGVGGRQGNGGDGGRGERGEREGVVRGVAARRRYARLQALAARVYGVREEELVYVLGTFGVIDEELRGWILEGYRGMRV
jgi:hypothetical protein